MLCSDETLLNKVLSLEPITLRERFPNLNLTFKNTEVTFPKCDLLAISVYERGEGTYWTALINPELPPNVQFSLDTGNQTAAVGYIRDDILSGKNFKLYSSRTIIDLIKQATNPKLLQVVL